MSPSHVPHAVIYDGEYILARSAVRRGLREGRCHLCMERVYLCSNRPGVRPYYAHCPRPARRHHSAPDGESDVHRLWCHETADVLNQMRLVGAPLVLEYPCSRCSGRHRIDLLDGTTRAVADRLCSLPGGLGLVRPDVGLVDGASVRKVLEGVYGHPLRQKTLSLFRSAGVLVLEVGLAVTLACWPRSPYLVQAGRYLARPWPAEHTRAGATCRLHWTEPACPRWEGGARTLGRSHFELLWEPAGLLRWSDHERAKRSDRA